MEVDARWRVCVETILRGEKVDFAKMDFSGVEHVGGHLRIPASSLAAVLMGRLSSDVAPRARAPRFELPSIARVHLDGGPGRDIWIVADESANPGRDPILDLSNLCSVLGGALPPLILRNCVIEGWFDISGSHFASITCDHCNLRGFKANGAQIDGDCLLRGLKPLDVDRDTTSLRDHPHKYCQVRMISARIDGTIDLRGTLLRSKRLEELWPTMTGSVEIPAQHYTEQFALSLASSEILGRIQLLGNFEAWGGVSFYQSEVHNSIRITSPIIAAHEAREYPPDRKMKERKCTALDLSEMRLKGTLAWTPERQVEIDGVSGNVYGRVELVRASIDGDVNLQNVRWLPLRHCNDGRSIEAKVTAPYRPNQSAPLDPREEPYASGGIDARYARIGGQVRIGDKCLVARRNRPMSGLRALNFIGPALDFWRATIDLGLRIERRSRLLGALQLNGARIGRLVFLASDITIDTIGKPRKSPYHLALDLSDARIDGYVVIHIGHTGARALKPGEIDPHVDGRVSLERAEVNGSIEIQRLAFRYKIETPGDYSEPGVSPAHAATRERFDETSILDMQDLRVLGGVNLKREAISVDFKPAFRPHNNFIVDLRGMSCTTWDDADGACWSKLNCKDAKDATPWRLRFDGIDLARLDTSTQFEPLRTNLVDGISWGRRPLRWLLSGRYQDRHFSVASSEQVTAFRRKALESFHENRNYQPATMPIAGQGYPHGPTDRLPRLRRILQHLERWTVLPSWKRRELMPPFSPQPYEVFARAYMARGETDTAIGITVDRMRRQWRRRVRLWTQFWAPLGALLVIAAVWALIFDAIFDTAIPRLYFLLGLATAVLPPFAMRGIAWLWGFCFGYGLSSRRALATVAGFVLFCSFATPSLVGGDRGWSGLHIGEHLIYGIDKLIPLNEPDMVFYPEAPRCIQHREEPKRLPIAHPEPEYLPYHAIPADDPCLFRQLNRIYDLIGWIVLSLTLLTLSGLFRRDIERTG